MGDGLFRPRTPDPGCRLQPALELSLDGAIQIQKTYSGWAVWVRPGYLPVRLNFKTVVGQLEAEIQERSDGLRFGRENVHAVFAQVQENALGLAAIGQNEVRRSLHGNAVGKAPLTIQQGGHRPQAGPSCVIGERLVQNEVGSAVENGADAGPFLNQSHGYRSVSGIQPARLFQHV